MSLKIERSIAIEAAQEAGNVIMRNYGEMQNLEWKIKTNFRTEVDKECDALIRGILIKNFPSYNLLSEEDIPIKRESEFTWVVDPLDGTIPYTYGISDHFSVCIALVKDKEPVLGVIYAPKREELYVGEKNRGAFCGNSPINISEENNLNRAIIGADPGKESGEYRRQDFAQMYKRLYSPEGVVCLLCSGCASVPLALVAAGKLHAYLSARLEPEDMAAAVPLIREAGGRVTNLYGKEWELGDRTILAANPKLHSNLFNFIRKA